MKGRLFLFEWNKQAAEARARELREAGWDVSVESEDGARGGKAVLANPPDVLVLDLARRPSHSRETAHALRSYKAGRNIPIVFVDADDENLKKTRPKVPDALFTTSGRLKTLLKRFEPKKEQATEAADKQA